MLAARQDTLAVTVPFFALVPCGCAAARSSFLPESAVAGLNGFVRFFALACMVMRLVAALPVRQLLDLAVIVVCLITAAAMVALTVAGTRASASRMPPSARCWRQSQTAAS